MRQRIPFLLFAFFYLVFSLGTYKDYGCTWDEKDTYQGGMELYQFIVHGEKPAYFDPEHSYPYPFLLNFFTSKINYEFFHLLNLLFALLLFWAVYEVVLFQTRKRIWALAGPVFLFLSLSFLGSIPANPKDVPFALFYFLSLAALYLFEENLPEFKARWAILGVLFAFTMSSRIVGFTLFPVLMIYDFYLFGIRKQKRGQGGFRKWFFWRSKDWFGVLATSQILCMVLWPYLGEHYFKHLINVFWLSAHFPPRFEFLFMGGTSDTINYPWYYLPLWIGFTTPLFLLVFFIYSFFKFRGGSVHHLYFLLGGAFLLNFGLYLLLHPAIYDGIRHFLFLIPILSTMAALAFIEFFRPIRPQDSKSPGNSLGKMTVGFLMVLNMGMTGAHLIRLHPYEYVYFNELAGGFKGAYGKYETDYWVASMKEAVEWLKKNEIKGSNRIYKIYAQGAPFQSQTYFNSNMIWWDKREEADFAVIMTRAGIRPGPGEETKIIHRVEREGAPLSFILKMAR